MMDISSRALMLQLKSDLDVMGITYTSNVYLGNDRIDIYIDSLQLGLHLLPNNMTGIFHRSPVNVLCLSKKYLSNERKYRALLDYLFNRYMAVGIRGVI